MVVEVAVVEQQHVVEVAVEGETEVAAVGEDVVVEAAGVEAAGVVVVVAGAEKTIMMFNTFIYFYF